MSPKIITYSRRGILFAALAGLFASSYLLYTYTTGAALKCGTLVHGCDAVRASEWASMFGIPTPVFGVIFYLAVLTILIARAYAPDYKPGLARLAQLLFGIAGFAESTILTYIQYFIIEQFCSWCLVSAISATAIFIFVFFDRKLSLEKSESAKELKVIGMSLATFFVIGGVAFAWLIQPVEAPPINPDFNQGQIDSLKPPSDATSTQAEEVPGEIIALGSHTPTQGPDDAKVTIIEFLDYECPACAIYHKQVIGPMQEKYQGQIRYAIRHFPLHEIHPHAVQASVAALCAGVQGNFFEMSDLLFENQKNLTRPSLESYAKELALDSDSFSSCLDSSDAIDQVLADRNDGRNLGVTGTPTIIINNAFIEGNPDLETLSKLIDERLNLD
jgi:protein-disulfide isomerase/uncharacterized membrane protein